MEWQMNIALQEINKPALRYMKRSDRWVLPYMKYTDESCVECNEGTEEWSHTWNKHNTLTSTALQGPRWWLLPAHIHPYPHIPHTLHPSPDHYHHFQFLPSLLRVPLRLVSDNGKRSERVLTYKCVFSALKKPRVTERALTPSLLQPVKFPVWKIHGPRLQTVYFLVL